MTIDKNKEHLIRPLLVEKSININAYDIDVMGIVNNIVYIRWFEDLRYFFLDTYYPVQEMLKDNFSPILAKTEIEYKKPLTIYDKISGHVWLSEVGRAKWTCSFEIFTEKRLHCIGKQTGYFFHLERKRPVAIPEKLLALYNEAIA